MGDLIMGVFAGGVGNVHTKKLAKRLNAEHSRNFYGVIVGANRVLYRHAQHMYTVSPSNNEKYWRWFWVNVTDEDFGQVDYILVHATSPKETFFLIPAGKAKVLFKQFANRVNVAVNPGGMERKRAGTRDMFTPYEMTFRKLKGILGA